MNFTDQVFDTTFINVAHMSKNIWKHNLTSETTEGPQGLLIRSADSYEDFVLHVALQLSVIWKKDLGTKVLDYDTLHKTYPYSTCCFRFPVTRYSTA